MINNLTNSSKKITSQSLKIPSQAIGLGFPLDKPSMLSLCKGNQGRDPSVWHILGALRGIGRTPIE